MVSWHFITRSLYVDIYVFIVVENSVHLSILETKILQLWEIFLDYFFVNSFSHPVLKINFFLELPLVSYWKPLDKSFIILIFFSYFLFYLGLTFWEISLNLSCNATEFFHLSNSVFNFSKSFLIIWLLSAFRVGVGLGGIGVNGFIC